MTDYTGFEGDAFSRFRGIDREGPIHMLNLVKMKDTATYEDGTTCSGREAYEAYGRDSGPIFRRVGGRIVWSGQMEFMLIGPEDEQWDYCFVAEYPSVDAFVEMIKDPAYREAMKHRQAGVETSRLIRVAPGEAGDHFG